MPDQRPDPASATTPRSGEPSGGRAELSVAAGWFARRTYGPFTADSAGFPAGGAAQRISVILPARNEEATVGAIVAAVRREFGDGLVDEIIVVDSASTDATTSEARAAGARVVAVAQDDPDDGKGAALRAGVQAMTGQIGVFLDADITDFDPQFVPRLLQPLLHDPQLQFVKGFYDRPWTGSAEGAVGGRVTELVARPLLAERVPELAAVAQPLAGECAFRRAALTPLRFVSGYGVDIGLLIGVLRRHGLEAIGQVDLGVRKHRHQDLDALGRMAAQVRAAVDLCLGDGETRTDRRTVVSRTATGAVDLTEEEVLTRLLPPIETPHHPDPTPLR